MKALGLPLARMKPKRASGWLCTPPGAITLPILILLAVAALVTCIASLFHCFAHNMTIDQKMAMQTGSFLRLFLEAVFPGPMIPSGHKQFAS